MPRLLIALLLGLPVGAAADPASPTPAPPPATAKSPSAAANPEGIWFGTLDAVTVKLRIAFRVTRKPDGTLGATLESLDQGDQEVAIERTTYAAPTLTFDLAARDIRYEAKLDGDTLTGTFTQKGHALPLTTRRVASLDGYKTPAKRPQEPRPPFPYHEEQVSVRVPDSYAPGRAPASITLTGTLTIPPGKGPFPAVLLITGSGPQDRDETVFGHKPFLVLADALARAGVATLRFDDRGTGSSGGSLKGLTTLDFARDTTAELKLLAARPEISPRALGLLGHSEGGIIAPIVATQTKLPAFLVLLAGTGMPGLPLLRLQRAALMRAGGATAEQLDRAQRTNDKVLAIVAKETDPRRIEAQVRTALAGDPEALAEVLPTLPAMDAWLHTLLTLDPTVYLKKIKVPVLALNGERDLQVDISNLALIEAAVRAGGNTSVTTVRLPELNHLLQHAKTGAVSEYATIEETIAPEALRKICDWIVATAHP